MQLSELILLQLFGLDRVIEGVLSNKAEQAFTRFVVVDSKQRVTYQLGSPLGLFYATYTTLGDDVWMLDYIYFENAYE